VIFIHATKISSADMDEKSAITKRYFVENSKILTSAGDRNNAGFLASYLCDNVINFAINFEAAMSAFHVKNMISPTMENIKILSI
jgi:hypothetical protein